MMPKKAIAAVLVMVMAAWAEMALAPMLAMHAGHMRPGHEMAQDMPAPHSGRDHAGHHHAEQIVSEQIVSRQIVTRAEERPCCPGLHKMEMAEVLEVTSGRPACDDPHSCCFRQGPQSVPAPVRDGQDDWQRLARAMAPAVAVDASPVRSAARFAIRDSGLGLDAPAEVFGMTLRV